jgi:ubiquinone/menaquinone biosynthesis C-methylase UbiE
MVEASDTQALGGPAQAYDRHVGRYGAQLASGLVEVAGVRPGQRALDVGCGPGSLTQVLAERLGGDNVAAVDPSEPFVAACRARVPRADVRVAGGEELPFAANEFDVVLAQLVVQLMDDRDKGVREMARVAQPGGVVAACVWDSRAMPLLQSFWDAALAVAPDRAGVLDEGRRIGYRAPAELADLWEACGLRDVSTGELTVEASYESFDDLFAPFAAGAGHSGATFVALEEAKRRRVRAEAHRLLGRPDGPLMLTARAWWACGRAA